MSIQFTKLTDEQLDNKIAYIEAFKNSNKSTTPAADLVGLDPNSNVSCNDMKTLVGSIHKDIDIQINRRLMYKKLEKKEKGLGDKYIEMIEDKLIYIHDETHLQSYCASISLDPLLAEGLLPIGGTTTPPKHLDSFCGAYIQLTQMASADLAGAVATVELFKHMAKFTIDDYGTDFDSDFIKAKLRNKFEQIFYAINQPCAARSGQSIFLNVTMFDENYYNHMFEHQFYPFGETQFVEYKYVDKIQRLFSDWMIEQRRKTILTFPVVTAAVMNDGKGSVKDKAFTYFLAEQIEKGDSFFVYQSDTPDSLSSCCRLRNEVDGNDFSFSLGAGGVKTGSIKVITININRLIQKNIDLGETVDYLHKFLISYREIIQDYIDNDMISIYKAHYIDIDRQFMTIGVNGVLEAAEFKGIKPRKSDPRYKQFIDDALGTIYDKNKAMAKETGFKFNTEFVPAENLGIKNAAWDKAEGITSNRDCYNSYFYAVEDEDVSPLEKFELHGDEYTSRLDGGSALHLNLNENLDKFQALKLFDLAAKTGCYYWCYNAPFTICENCGHIHRTMTSVCPECKSTNVSYATRVIGYLRPVKNWSKGRRSEFGTRKYHDTQKEVA